MADPIIKQLDLVELLTIKNVSYLSTKPGHSPSPHGKWTVVGIIEGEDILISKDEALIRIPLNDVRKIESYDISKVLDSLRKIANGKIRKEEAQGKADALKGHFKV